MIMRRVIVPLLLALSGCSAIAAWQPLCNGKLAAEITDVDPAKRAIKGVIALQIHAGPSIKAEFNELRLQNFTASFHP